LSRLVVVSNRVAVPKRGDAQSAGGLAVALRPALEKRGGLWFGWSGQTVEGEPDAITQVARGTVTYATLDLSRKDLDEYYNGFANRVLWPLCHYRLDLTEFNRRDLAGYYRVNQGFARRLAPLVGADDLIWVHDYHLIPLAAELRERGLGNRMGFFMHIPWPPMGLMLALPHHERLVRGLSAYDLVGFQTEIDVENFLRFATHEAGGRILEDGRIELFGRTLRVGAFPIGIETATFEALARDAMRTQTIRRFRQSLSGRDLIIGVDRLDYSKGIGQRMESFDRLLAIGPDLGGRVTYLQIAPKSREDVPEYASMQQTVAQIAGRINGAHAAPDWTPIRYVNQAIGRAQLAGYYRVARIGLVTPLRDGMNLVAKEYVAAQDPEDPGVLVLSRFAGAAQEMRDGALLVNPYDIDETAYTMRRALAMSRDERRERWGRMIAKLRENDVFAWCDRYLAVLADHRGA
jgi:trehalose 6-phosphate synthase